MEAKREAQGKSLEQLIFLNDFIDFADFLPIKRGVYEYAIPRGTRRYRSKDL
jgi:hypothetical protein